jgi:MFS family permease
MLLYGTVPLAWSFGTPVWLLYLVLPACEAIGMVFQVTYVTAVRNLAGGEHITEANGRLYATATAAAVLGPLLAGVVSGAFGPAAAIGADAASFAVSAAGSFLIRLRPADSSAAADAVASQASIARWRRAWREFLAGAEFLWRQRVLRTLTVLLTLYIFLTYWDAYYTQTGESVSAHDPFDTNETITAGGSASFGMQGTYTASDAVPTSFTMTSDNGQTVTCTTA